MRYTASHWGAYQFEEGATALSPLDGDTAPSRIGRGWVSAAQDANSRIMQPAVRRGWLAGDGGAGRCRDGFVEVSWDMALALAAGEINRVRKEHGNGAIFGGSYGWASAGRFHHAQGHMRRFLNMVGGYVAARDTYSHAAAEVLFPHVLGLTNQQMQDQMTSMPLIAAHCDVLLAFGGISARTAQITSAGTTRHEVPDWLETLRSSGARLINVSPRATDFTGAEWWSIRPGTDVALMLALTWEIVAADRADTGFLDRCTSGWPDYRAYLSGETDGQPKTADWAAPLCALSADRIRALAIELVDRKSMITLNWGMQRADHGEQPLWAGLGLACVIGQIGQPGTGFGFGYGSTTPVGRAARLIPWPSVPQGVNPVKDYIPVARLTDMLETPGDSYPYNGEVRVYPDIRLIWWTGGNPFHHQQDLNRLERAWQKPETVIVNDHSWTATARRADIVLPATSPLERHDIMMNRRDPSLIYMSPLMKPPGAARDDFVIFSDLAERMGFGAAYTEGRDTIGWLRHLWDQSRAVARAEGVALPAFDMFREMGRFDLPDSAETRIALQGFVADPAGAPLATESGRITLFNNGIAAMAHADCPGHPCWLPSVESLLTAAPDELHLISGQPDTRLHAQNDRGSEAQGDKVEGREAACLHPDTARAHGLAAGDVLRLYNTRGACLAGLRLSEEMCRDCIALATGAWFDPQIVDGVSLEVHGNPNALTLDKGTSSLAQGNIAHTTLVRIALWTGPLPELTIARPPTIVARNTPREG